MGNTLNLILYVIGAVSAIVGIVAWFLPDLSLGKKIVIFLLSIAFVLLCVYIIGEVGDDSLDDILISDEQISDEEPAIDEQPSPVTDPDTTPSYTEGTAFNPYVDYKAGNTFTMGTIEQDNNLNNGAEPIEWQVLDVDGNRALVLAQYGLTYRDVHFDWRSVTWEDTEIRTWLNNDFLYDCFTDDERSYIPETHIDNHANTKHGTDSGSDTWDSVFLLSTNEVEDYLRSSRARQCKPSSYALKTYYKNDPESMNAYSDSDGWWLRTRGKMTDWNCRVKPDGTINYDGAPVKRVKFLIRPAFYVDLY